MKHAIRFVVSVMALGTVSFLATPFLPKLIEWLSPMPDNLGLENGKLRPCPSTPNCVSSYETDEMHGMDFIEFDGSAKEAQQLILHVLNQMSRIKVVTVEPGYIHVEFRTRKMQFIDDAEFHFGEAVEGIQFRAAARLGMGDGGMNRARMNKFRRLFAAAVL